MPHPTSRHLIRNVCPDNSEEAGQRIVDSDFRPAWWLPGPHLQTLFPSLLRRSTTQLLRRERVELPDGDFLDLDWHERKGDVLVLVLHGLEGSSRSAYARGILQSLTDHGLSAVLMHFRGCSGEPNRSARSYHSGETADLDYVVGILKQRGPFTAFGILGYSLGGNVLLKWLGEQGTTAGINAAAAVSVPFELSTAADRMACGVSRMYQWYLLRKLKRSLIRKKLCMALPLRISRPEKLHTLREFDDKVTAPLHGFLDADDYYRQSSCRQWLKHIVVPTLILHAVDDPFMTPAVIPTPEELSLATQLELSQTGGHVGFVSGARPWAPRYWLESRVCAFFRARLGVTRETPK